MKRSAKFTITDANLRVCKFESKWINNANTELQKWNRDRFSSAVKKQIDRSKNFRTF